MRQDPTATTRTLEPALWVDQKPIALMHREEDERVHVSSSFSLDITNVVSAG
jgi:hypothetical protein